MKGIKKALCLLVLLFSVALALPVTANASTNGHTAQEALAWAKAQVGKSLDYDGVYGAQCVDLIKYYYDFLGCASYARGNGCDYATNALPSGWARYQGAQPQPGDILVYSGNASNPYGHVAIYEADRVTYHQNLDYNQWVVCSSYQYNRLGNPYWGVIRPDFVSAPVSATWEGPTLTSVTETNATVAGKVTFSQNLTTTSAGMRLFDQSGNLLTYYKPDTTNYNSNYVTFDFNINTELYYTLSPGKTYKVQFYTVSGGKEYTSPTTSFTTPHTHNYQNGLCTICGAKDPNYKLTAPTVKPSYVGASGKPYIYWSAVDGANRYYVYRSTTKDGTYSFLGSTANLNYTDSKADAGTTYYYKVKAGIVNGVKSNSSAAVAITCRCARPVVKPSYVGASGKPYIYWSAVAGASQYEVYRSTTKDGTYSFLDSTANLNYTDSKANVGTTYYYKVKALAADGTDSSLSAAVAITCRCARPVVKTDYWASTGKPYIKWDAVDGAGKYYIYRSGTRNGTYTLLGTTTATNYTDSKANAGYTYYYKVQAISSALTMAKVYLSPSNQTDNCYAYGNTTEAVQCGKIADSCRIALERSGVTVQVGHMPSMQDKCKESNAFGADLHVPIHTNAFNGTVTGTRMFCLNSSGEGMKACEAIFAWLAPITPGTSENIQVDASLYEVRVPSAPAAYVECEFHDNATTAKWIVEHTVDIGEAIARGICDYFGVTYKEKEQPESAASTDKLYRVQEGAFANRPIAEEKNTANSSLSAAVAITCRCARPVVKTDYWASTGKPYIKWTAVAGASKYYVYRSTSKDGTYEYIGYTTKTNYTDSKANAGYTYYYKVQAISSVKSKANSALSAAVTITCRCARPSVKITTSNGSPRLTWNAVTGAAKYEVYRATSKNGSYTKMFTTSNLSYTNTSAKAGTTYYYKVKAVSKVKSTANSAFSTVVSIRAR